MIFSDDRDKIKDALNKEYCHKNIKNKINRATTVYTIYIYYVLSNPDIFVNKFAQ